MKMQRRSACQRQQGFTIIEIAIAMFLGLLVIGAIVSTFGENKTDTQIGIAKIFLSKDLPEAIQAEMIRSGGNFTTAKLLQASLYARLTAKKASAFGGGSWTISALDSQKKVVSVTYPVPNTAVATSLRSLKTQVVTGVTGTGPVVATIAY